MSADAYLLGPSSIRFAQSVFLDSHAPSVLFNSQDEFLSSRMTPFTQ